MILELIKDWKNPTSGLTKKKGLIFETDNTLGQKLIQDGVAKEVSARKFIKAETAGLSRADAASVKKPK